MRERSLVRGIALCLSLAALMPAVARSQPSPAAPAATAPAPAAPPAPSDATAPPPADATSAAAAPAERDRRTLDGHRFIPAADVRWPFTITNLESQLVLVYGTTTASLDVANQRFDGTMTYAGMGGVLGYEYAFLDHYSVRGVLDNVVYSGIDGKSAITVGSKLQLGFDLGGTASFPIGDSAKVGVLFDVTQSPNLALTIASGLQAIRDTCNAGDCTVETDKIFGATEVTTVQPAAAVSWTPMRPLGVTANLAYQHYSSSGAATVSGNALRLSTALDWDFLAHTSVPVGLMVQFAWLTPFNSTGLQHITDLGGGIFYTGRKDVSAGFQLISRRFAVSPTVNVSWSTILAEVGLRYFW